MFLDKYMKYLIAINLQTLTHYNFITLNLEIYFFNITDIFSQKWR